MCVFGLEEKIKSWRVSPFPNKKPPVGGFLSLNAKIAARLNTAAPTASSEEFYCLMMHYGRSVAGMIVHVKHGNIKAPARFSRRGLLMSSPPLF